MALGTVMALLAATLVVCMASGLALRLHRQGRVLRIQDLEIERLHDRVWHLSESEERYRALVEADTAFVVQKGTDGRISFANEGYARLMGRTPAALVGSRERLAIVEEREAPPRAGGARSGEFAVVPADGGDLRWFAWVETPIVGRGGETEFLIAGRDITERIESARTLDEARTRAEAASVAKSRFLATVSHEFRTPLNGILGMASLVLDTDLSPEQRTYIQAVRTSGEALLTLIDEILDFSKIEAGRLDLAAEPFDLPGLVQSAVELLAPRAQDKGIEIAALIHRGVPRRVVGDADRVRQILMNLAGNAIKFTDVGGVSVEIERCEKGLVVAIRDTGPGIPADRLPILFEEFEQGDGSASRRHEGTGLGLAITRRIVKRMGGALTVESEVGVGSTFRARLVLPEVAGTARVGDGVPALPGRRVLIVATSPFEAPALAHRLGEEGAQVRHANSAEEGISLLPAFAPQAVLVDRALGDEAVRVVAQAARTAGAVRSLVLLSPFDRRDFGPPAAAGFDGYLVKPVRTASLIARLTEPMPASLAVVAERPTTAPRPVAVERGAEGMRVLLAEDNEINALLARVALERLGATVTWARNGIEALDLATPRRDPRPFDLALLDIRMPGLDGLEVVRRLRRLEADAGAAPLACIALTANALSEDEAVARAAGFDSFLPKPLDLNRLAGLVRRREAA